MWPKNRQKIIICKVCQIEFIDYFNVKHCNACKKQIKQNYRETHKDSIRNYYYNNLEKFKNYRE